MSRGNVALIAVVALLIFGASRPQVAVPGRALTLEEVRKLARETTARYFPQVDPSMLVTMAWIESGFNPTATRIEPHLPDLSAGLMQTLHGTAEWLAGGAFGQLGMPTVADLYDPATSMYFGAAYVAWLKGQGITSTECLVRAYNGGPKGCQRSATLGHWAKYQAARARGIN